MTTMTAHTHRHADAPRSGVAVMTCPGQPACPSPDVGGVPRPELTPLQPCPLLPAGATAEYSRRLAAAAVRLLGAAITEVLR
jgi:hypothetical protein